MIKNTLDVAGFAAALVLTGGAVFAQSESNDGSALSRERYLPEYTESGDLILPKNFHEWVFVGSPLTPNAINGDESWKLPVPTTYVIARNGRVALADLDVDYRKRRDPEAIVARLRFAGA